MAKKFLYKTVVTTITTPEGAEHTQETKELIQIESEPFYIVYTKYIKWIYGINSGKTLALLLKLLDMMEFNTGVVDVSRSKRQLLMTELGLSQSALSQRLNALLEKEAIYKRGVVDEKTGEMQELKGSYQVNPIMFWKGNLKERKALRVQFETIDEPDLNGFGDEYTLFSFNDNEENED